MRLSFLNLIVLGPLAGVVLQLPLRAQVPVQVPQDLPASRRAMLNVEKAGLDDWHERLKATALAHNRKCTGVPANTSLDNQCRGEQASLEAEKAKYYAAVKRFNGAVAAAASQQAATPRPAASLIPNIAAHPSGLNMDALYPQETCEAAASELTRLQPLKAGLEAKLKELSAWRERLKDYSREFDDLRAETVRHDLSDILSVIPAPAFADALVKSGYVTAEAAHTFSVAYKSLTVLASQTDAFTTSDDTKKLKKTLDSTLGVKKIMISIPFHSIPKDDPNRVALERTMFAIDAFAKVIVFSLKEPEPGGTPSSFYDRMHDFARPLADLTLDIASAYPNAVGPLAKAGRFGKDEFVKYRKKAIADEALESLGAALGTNWNASLQLGQRLEKVKADIVEEERIRQACQMH